MERMAVARTPSQQLSLCPWWGHWDTTQLRLEQAGNISARPARRSEESSTSELSLSDSRGKSVRSSHGLAANLSSISSVLFHGLKSSVINLNENLTVSSTMTMMSSVSSSSQFMSTVSSP